MHGWQAKVEQTVKLKIPRVLMLIREVARGRQQRAGEVFESACSGAVLSVAFSHLAVTAAAAGLAGRGRGVVSSAGGA